MMDVSIEAMVRVTRNKEVGRIRRRHEERSCKYTAMNAKGDPKLVDKGVERKGGEGRWGCNASYPPEER